MGSTFSNNNYDSEVHFGKDFVIPEEVFKVIYKVQKEIKKNEILHENRDFEIPLEGNGESTKKLVAKQFPQCEITLGSWYKAYFHGTGKHERAGFREYDSLKFKCKQ